jgi:hypothetical protein
MLETQSKMVTRTLCTPPGLWRLATKVAAKVNLSRSRLIRVSLIGNLVAGGVTLRTPDGALRLLDGRTIDPEARPPAVVIDCTEADLEALFTELEADL